MTSIAIYRGRSNPPTPPLEQSPYLRKLCGSQPMVVPDRRKSTAIKVLRLESGLSHMIKVKSRGNETAEQMLRRFKKMCEKEGLTKDIKRVAYYEKPSEKRRRRSRSKPKVRVGR
jgi:small subunit ribosomal protein S21